MAAHPLPGPVQVVWLGLIPLAWVMRRRQGWLAPSGWGMTAAMNPVDILRSRGFIKSHTDLDALAAAMAEGPVTFYVGFDPTGDNLHVGHLLPVMAMAHLQQAGHKPIVVLGGGTAMVGDPSGKDKTREILTPAKIQDNLAAMRVQFARFLDIDGCEVVDNAEWLMGLGYINFLRDVGRHFSVNKMMTAEGIKQRLDRNQGLSFIEFNYHLLQSYDFLVLHDKYGCTLQVGGDDQWFNILGGVELIRRERRAASHALTIPLLQTADGKKMGKTEKGAVWLDAARSAPTTTSSTGSTPTMRMWVASSSCTPSFRLMRSQRSKPSRERMSVRLRRSWPSKRRSWLTARPRRSRRVMRPPPPSRVG